MAWFVVRGLDRSVKDSIAAQAERNGRSFHAEVREILTQASRPAHIGMALLEAARAAGGVEELPVPPRGDGPAAADLSG